MIERTVSGDLYEQHTKAHQAGQASRGAPGGAMYGVVVLVSWGWKRIRHVTVRIEV